MNIAIQALAEYFTGKNVTHFSLLRSTSSSVTHMAERFFHAREALGIKGYPTKEEAAAIIQKELAK